MTSRIGAPGADPRLLRAFERALEAPRAAPLRLAAFAVAAVPPAAAWPRGLVFVPDEAGGPTLAFSDGTDWRRVQDGAVIS